MKIEWQSGAYYAKISQLLTSDKLVIKYKGNSNYSIYNVRMFDPAGNATEFLNMTYADHLKNTTSIGYGPRAMPHNNETKLMMVSIVGSDKLVKINYSNPENLVYVGGVTDSADGCSLDQVRQGHVDWTNGLWYGGGYADDYLDVYNITANNPVCLSSKTNTSAINYIDGIWDAVYYDAVGTRYAIVSASLGAKLSVWNVTNPAATPVYVSSISSSASCPLSYPEGLHLKSGTSLIFVAAAVSDAITILNISNGGTLTCLNYTIDSTSPGSLNGMQLFHYEEATNLIYAPATISDELSIYNVSNPYIAPVFVGGVSLINSPQGISNPVVIGGTKYIFVGYYEESTGISAINVTNPAAPTLATTYYNATGAPDYCIFNGTYDMFVDGNYLYAGSGSDTCLYSIKLYEPITEAPAENTTCSTPSLSSTNSYANDTILCTGVYNFTTVLPIWLNASSNMYLDCNGSTLQDLTPTNGSYGIQVGYITGSGNSLHNITIKNCNINGFAVGIGLRDYSYERGENVSIYNNNITHSGGLAGIYVDGYQKFDIYNNRIYDNLFFGERTIGAHGIYIAGGTARSAEGGRVYNNIIYNVTTGIKINADGRTKNIEIYNNTIYNSRPPSAYLTGDIGIHLLYTENISVYNNNITNMTMGSTRVGVYLDWDNDGNYLNSTIGSKVYNNNFNQMYWGVYVRKGTINASIYNNTYVSNSIAEISVNDTSNIDVYETDMMNLVGSSGTSILLYLNFTGAKNFTINNFNFTIRNGQSQWYPYDDVKNATTILASDVDTYNKILSKRRE